MNITMVRTPSIIDLSVHCPFSRQNIQLWVPDGYLAILPRQKIISPCGPFFPAKKSTLGRRRLRDHSSPPKNQLWVADGFVTTFSRQKINFGSPTATLPFFPAKKSTLGRRRLRDHFIPPKNPNPGCRRLLDHIIFPANLPSST